MSRSRPILSCRFRSTIAAAALSLIALLAVGSQGRAQSVKELLPQVSVKVKDDGGKITVEVIPDKRTVEQTVTDASGKVQEKTVCPLDDRNLAMGAVHYDAKGNVRYKEIFHRDASDRVTQINYTAADGKPLGHRVFNFQGDKVVSKDDYDAQGNLIPPQQATPKPRRH